MGPHRFCAKPFKRAHIAQEGSVYVCCRSWLPVPLGNCFEQPFVEIWNSPAAQKIRAQSLDGSLAMCNPDLCPHIVSGDVNRAEEREGFEEIIRFEKTVLDSGPRFLSLNYDFSCNLKCRSCRSGVRVLSQEKQEYLIRFQKELLESDIFRSVRRITVSGSGEALASAVYQDLFSRISRERFPDLRITLRTNGLLLIAKKWAELKNIHYAVDVISVSLDAATDATYQSIRQGGDFAKVIRNLEAFRFDRQRADIRLKLNFVVQESNFREMRDFVVLGKRIGAGTIAFTRLMNTGTFSHSAFQHHAVHRSNHPQHAELLRILEDPLFKDPIVNFRNLSFFRKEMK